MKKSITVHKLDEKGNEVLSYEGAILHETSHSVTLEATFNRHDIDIHGLPLRKGDRFVETYYNNRWYNVFAVYDVDDNRLKGWYCNITRPARIENSHVYADDLALDIVVFPDGRWKVLDEDEFAALGLSFMEHQRAKDALDKLIKLIETRNGPFFEKSRPTTNS
jgi:protein associated with RNAse G/E